MRYPCGARYGFSLVELSIVLVILGLLVGGVLSGQSLIRAAELRSIPMQQAQFITAIYSFRDKYFAFPGDLTNATSFWNKDSTNCYSDTGTGASPGSGVCNGNGDGLISFGPTVGAPSEGFQAWRHLGYAGWITGTYTGLAGGYLNPATGLAPTHILGVNSPKGRISGTGWGISHIDNSGGASNGYWFQRNYLQYLNVGLIDTFYADDPFLKAEDAWNIDTKLDDGKPATGKVQSNYFLTTACTNAASATDYNTTYKLSDPTALCSLLFSYGT